MFTLNFILAENDSKANLPTECESMANDPVTFGRLFSILTPFYALDKCINLIIALNFIIIHQFQRSLIPFHHHMNQVANHMTKMEVPSVNQGNKVSSNY